MSTVLEVLKATQQVFFRELREYPHHVAYLCICARLAGRASVQGSYEAVDQAGCGYRRIVRYLLELDGIDLNVEGFGHPGIEFVRRAHSDNERRRIWLAEKIRELSS